MPYSPLSKNGGELSVNGDDVRNMRFVRRLRAYDPHQVDQLLDRVAEELDAGRAVLPLIGPVGLKLVMRGYDRSAVDAFLDQILDEENDFEPARLSTDPWRDLAVWDFVIRRQGDDLSRVVGRPRNRR